MALAAYNAGPGAVLAAGRSVPDYPETLAYVPRVLEYAEEYRGPAADLPVPADEPSEGIDDGAWGGYANGRIPAAVLAAVAPGERLRADAADAWRRMTAAHRAQLGRPIGVTDTYRSYSQQVELAAYKGTLAATPGSSNHGWGLAVDLVVPGGYDDPTYRWLAANGPRFGWVNPDWAREGGSKPEPWHWEFVGGRGNPDAVPAACLPPAPRDA
ncbi:MAG: D-alanyl-D-alanine carboxypeptidase family protein [Actinobacteria bacterium]|nr:D-alanyl-D-alanine carboxypeptidase family protein [Actinomycetota bacterium]